MKKYGFGYLLNMNGGLLIILCSFFLRQDQQFPLPFHPLSLSLSLSLSLFLLSDCLSFFIQPCIHFDSALAADKCEMNTVSVHSLCSSLSLSHTLHLSLLCVFWRLDSEDLASWFSLSLFLSEEDIQNWVSFF